jgi:hypothetical protein
MNTRAKTKVHVILARCAKKGRNARWSCLQKWYFSGRFSGKPCDGDKGCLAGSVISRVRKSAASIKKLKGFKARQSYLNPEWAMIAIKKFIWLVASFEIPAQKVTIQSPLAETSSDCERCAIKNV